MGLRFRRSIRIAPGIRLNLSASGLSATVGPRGASLNIGSRGTYLNTGLPGTGLSYRQRISGSQQRSQARTTYRQLQIAAREGERARAKQYAAEEHRIHEERLAALRGVLLERTREEYNWQLRWSSMGSFLPPVLASIEASDLEAEAADAAAAALPIFRWLLLVTALAIPAIIWGDPSLRSLAAVGIVAIALWAVSAFKSRKSIAGSHYRTLVAESQADLKRLTEAHDVRVAKLIEEFETAEQDRARFRTALDRQDFDALTQVLEAELQNERFPVPIVLDLELISLSEARIEFALPELDEIPAERTRLTKTGKLSVRSMTQRDRISLYKDLCTGVCLRLTHETFRVLGSLQSVELFGTADGADPATGHAAEFVALHLAVDRERLQSIDLDRIDPNPAFDALGGHFSCDRRGHLTSLTGVTGLHDDD